MAVKYTNIIKWNVTKACNLKCSYCYNATRRKSQHILPRSHYLQIAKNISSPTVLVKLSGGEPTLFPYLKETVDEITKNHGMFSLLTNGMYSFEKHEDIFNQPSYRGQMFSLDGYKEGHMIGRTKSNVQRIVENIQSSRHLDGGGFVTINCVISELNYLDTVEILDYFLNRIGVDRVCLSKLTTGGRQDTSSDYFMGKAIELADEYLLKHKDDKSRIEIATGCQRRLNTRPLTNVSLDYQCSAGRKSIFIDFDALVYPCEKAVEWCRRNKVVAHSAVTSNLYEMQNSRAFDTAFKRTTLFRNGGSSKSACGSCQFRSSCMECPFT